MSFSIEKAPVVLLPSLPLIDHNLEEAVCKCFCQRNQHMCSMKIHMRMSLWLFFKNAMRSFKLLITMTIRVTKAASGVTIFLKPFLSLFISLFGGFAVPFHRRLHVLSHAVTDFVANA